MNSYRLVWNIDDEIEAEDEDQAYDIFINRIKRGFYGPTHEHLEMSYSEEPIIV